MKRSLTQVKGVTKADVSLEKAEAQVRYDDAQTNIDALIKATTAVGYPSGVKK